MANVFDVAEYITSTIGGKITAMKLQKLCYYSFVEYLVTQNKELFPERFQAWRNGPVCKALFYKHKGLVTCTASLFKPFLSQPGLTRQEMAAIDRVIETYGDETGDALSKITHQERPWIEARGGIPEGQKCDNEISIDSIRNYYTGYDCYHTYGIEASVYDNGGNYTEYNSVNDFMKQLGTVNA